MTFLEPIRATVKHPSDPFCRVALT